MEDQSAIKTTYWSILGNVSLALIKGIAGIFGNSYALIADAIESTADVFSSFIVLLGFKYAERPADENHPYGHGKIEPLVTFVVVAFLVISAAIIAFESVQNIMTPHKTPQVWTLYVLGAIILWKEFSYQYVIRKSRLLHSSSLKAEAWHHRSDAISSVMAFVGVSIAVWMGKGYETADDWAALLASGLILYNSYHIFRPALGEIMDEHLYDDIINQIREESLKVNGILGTEKCFVRKAGMSYHIDLHALISGNLTVTQGHDLSHQLKDHLTESIPHVGFVLIHIEPFDETKTVS